MNAIHVFSTAPFFAKNGNNARFRTDKFDVYCTVLSALSWRALGGSITLRTDKRGKEYFGNLGISKAWNSIETDIPEDFLSEEGIDPLMFWAAAKLFALRGTPSPAVVIDMDFIVWKKPALGNKIIAAHSENITKRIYPDISYFKMKPGYAWRNDFNYSVLPSNTAFLYLPDESFKQFYVSNAIEFMKMSVRGNDYLRYMVYAEQRLLSLCADYLKYDITYLLDKDKLFLPQNDYTHLWGAKQAMRDDLIEQERFCIKCRSRIIKDFPEFQFLLKNIQDNKDFMK